MLSRTRLILAGALFLTSAAGVGAQSNAPSSQAAPQKQHGPTVTLGSDDSIAFVVDRKPLRQAAFAIVTTDGTGALLLTDSTIVAQLTDAGLDHMGRDIDHSMRSDSTADWVARLVSGAVAGALKPLMDHGIAYRLRDLAEARYTDGRLQLRRRNGELVFNHMEWQGHEVLESFSPDDAREFARRAQAAAARLR